MQLVRNEDDRGVLVVDERAHYPEQVRSLLWRKHGRRLVENEHPCLAIQRLQDFDALLDPDGQVAHQRIGIDR